MRRLAMSCAAGYPFRWHNRYLSDQQISKYFQKSKTDFYTGIYSIDDDVSPYKYKREIVQELPLKGDLIVDVDAHTNVQKNNVRNIIISALEKLRSLNAQYLLHLHN